MLAPPIMCSRFCLFERGFRFCCGLSRNLVPKYIGICFRRTISISARCDKKNFRSPIKYTQHNFDHFDDCLQKEEEEEDADFSEEKDLEEFIERNFHIQGVGHETLVVQPYIKWGPQKNRLTTPELQLEEAVTLIKTLRDWKVAETRLVPLENLNKSTVFGKGKLDELKQILDCNSNITAVFISINMLKPAQQESLQEFLGVPIFDRYGIVIQILREHAATKEAKLQIKLAELPYLWSRFKRIQSGSLINFGGEALAIGTTWKGKEFHRNMLKRREAKIKDEIEVLRHQRKFVKKNRIKNEIPIVAVLGYTNAGKTSLIKALTGNSKLEPQNYLFATLDVTVHKGKLPSSLEVLYIDTLGFISDIPTMLFQSFITTLEDTKVADVIIHVRDVSHPDTVAQNHSIKNILNLMQLPNKLNNHIITVGNKIDLLDKENLERFKNDDMILISASKMIGTDVLLQKIDETVLNATDRKIMTLKLKSGGIEYNWIHENVTVFDETPFPDDNNYMLLKVIITNVALAKFRHIFIKNYSKTRDCT